MTARQLDMLLCESLGGSHWLKHLLNATVLYASAKALLIGAHSSMQSRALLTSTPSLLQSFNHVLVMSNTATLSSRLVS
jgi:hypothetical protein